MRRNRLDHSFCVVKFLGDPKPLKLGVQVGQEADRSGQVLGWRSERGVWMERWGFRNMYASVGFEDDHIPQKGVDVAKRDGRRVRGVLGYRMLYAIQVLDKSAAVFRSE
jgi:hypothetical protein